VASPPSACAGSLAPPANTCWPASPTPSAFWFGNDLRPVWVPLDGPIELLNGMGLSEPDLEAIRWKNAARLFGLPLRGQAKTSA
jgi:hypothetical protein